MASKYCPTCNETYPTNERICRRDQEVLSLKDPYHLVGRTLIDKYKITALVGLGGMGAVYHAYHLGIDRRVAFKILQPNLAVGDDYVVELFEREAKLAGRLMHENIVDVTDAGHTPDGIAYIVMEWLEGRTLDEELSRLGRFDFKRAVGIIAQITAALVEAHSKRVIHRDLKPGNIMLVDTADGRDQVKVLDFGIGKAIEGTTADSPVSALVGTPQFASPEQLTIGSHIDGRSDIYSLGVIFYRLLGGQLPFNCTSMGELLRMQLTVTPPPLGELRPETPPGIEVLVNEMLAKDPAGRPQSAGEVLARLARLQIESLDSANYREHIHTMGLANLKTRELEERTTEEFVVISPPPKSDRETRLRAVPPGQKSVDKRGRASLLYGSAILATVLAGSYGLYRFRQTPVPAREGQAIIGNATSPSPSPVPMETPTSSPAVAVSKPKPTNKPTSTPTPLKPSPTAGISPAARQRAAEHLRRARELYNQSEYQPALRECNEALRLNPNQTEARELKRKIGKVIRILNNR